MATRDELRDWMTERICKEIDAEVEALGVAHQNARVRVALKAMLEVVVDLHIRMLDALESGDVDGLQRLRSQYHRDKMKEPACPST